MLVENLSRTFLVALFLAFITLKWYQNMCGTAYLPDDQPLYTICGIFDGAIVNFNF